MLKLILIILIESTIKEVRWVCETIAIKSPIDHITP